MSDRCVTATPPRRLAGGLLIASMLAVGAAACDFEQPSCVRDSDCRPDFVCSRAGFCDPDWDAIRADSGDARGENDAGEEDADAGEDVEDTREDPVDRDTINFDSCVGETSDSGCFTRYEPNDNATNASELTAGAFGCTGSEGDFRDLDTVKTAGLCGSDAADWYELEYVECRDQSFRIDVVVDPFPENCSHDAYALDIRIGDRTFHCSPDEEEVGSDARCTTLSGGGRQLTIFVDDTFQPSVNYASIVVKSTAERGSAFFDYDMRVRIF
jgi:hypothetical protein